MERRMHTQNHAIRQETLPQTTQKAGYTSQRMQKLRPAQNAFVAQTVEQRIEAPRVDSPKLSRSTICLAEWHYNCCIACITRSTSKRMISTWAQAHPLLWSVEHRTQMCDGSISSQSIKKNLNERSFTCMKQRIRISTENNLPIIYGCSSVG